MLNQRYNVFNQIHKGLRGMLYETAIQVQQTDFSRPEAQVVVDQLKQVLLFFDKHADSEDRFILPHLRIHNGQFVDELEEEHELDHRLTQTLFDHIQEWQTSTMFSQREVIGQRLSVAFSEFIAFNLCHMNREENELLDLLWQHYTDAQIRQMQGQILQSLPPQTLLAESRWMMRSINDKEVINWLSGMKQGAPIDIFRSFLKMAEEELPAGRFINVKAMLELA